MSDTRGAPSYGEIAPVNATFTYDGSITRDVSRYDGLNGSAQVGDAVELVADHEVGLGTTAHYPMGLLIRVESDVCTVQIAGVVAFPYDTGNVSNPPLVGRGVQVDGAGKVITPTGGARLATERGTVISLDSVAGLAYTWLP